MADSPVEIYGIDELEAAFRSAFLYRGDLTYGIEEWLIILHNHLIWDSYERGNDPMADIIIMLLKDKGLQ